MNTPMLLCFLAIGFFSACVDQDFDTPPTDAGTSDLVANTTLADLKSQHIEGEFEEITEDAIIEAVVVADDETGNFYRQLIIQDETGGIELRINVNDLYTEYPIGRKVFVKCQGLWLGDFNGLIQMGAGTYDDDGELALAGLEAGGVAEHIEKGPKDQVITPKTVRITDLTGDIYDPNINTLIQLEEVEFVSPGQTFATYNIDSGDRFSENRTIRDCNGNSLDLRSSGFSDFVNDLTPTGKGNMVAIYSVYRGGGQMYIRTTDDINFSGPQCDGGVIGGDLEQIDISEVRALFTGATTSAPSGKKIVGTVISDFASGNINTRNLFIQDQSGSGITVRLEAEHSYGLNEQLEIDISGVELSEFAGLLQLNNVGFNKVTSIGQGSVTPRTITIADIKSQFETLESSLVKIENVTMSKSDGSTNFGGDVILNDGTSTIEMFSFNNSAFGNENIPTNTVTLTGIVSQFDDQQIVIRNINDIEGGNNTGGNPPTGDVNETFENTTPGVDLNLNGWANIAVKGSRLWRSAEFGVNVYAQATAFNDSNPEMESWLISPEIDLDEDKKLSFESAYGFYTHDGLSVWVSSDFDGNNVGSATWTQLNARITQQSDAEHAWIPSGDIDLSGFSGKIRIGFKYIGNPNDGTTSYRIDNVKVEDQ